MLSDVRVSVSRRAIEVASCDPIVRASVNALIHPTPDFDEGHWILVHIVVNDPKQRKQGLGSSLLAKLKSTLLRQGCRRLLVRRSEIVNGAETFYLKNGFEAAGDYLEWRPLAR